MLLFAGADEPSIGKILDRAEQEVAKRNYLSPMYEGVLKIVEEFVQLRRAASAGETSLHLAVKTGWKPALIVLAHLDGLDQKDAQGWTPLHLAAAIGDGESLRLLISNEADLGAKDHLGRTAAAIATEYQNENIMKVFRMLAQGGYDACA